MSTWEKMGQKQVEAKAEVEEASVSFQKLTSEMSMKKLKVGAHGQQKTGKTRFGMSSCLNFGPTYIIATEPGIFPLSRLFPDKEIYFVKNSYGEPTVYELDTSGTFEVETVKTLKNIDQAVRSVRKLCLEDPSKVGTVVVDSVTDVWKWVQEWMKTEILKIDKTARVKQQWDWGYANNKYQNIIMQLISLPCHVILTAQDREEYVGAGAPSGNFEPRWQVQTPYWVDIVMGFEKRKDKNTNRIKYYATIEDSRHMDDNLQPIAGIETENPTFDKLVSLLKPKEVVKNE